MEVWKEGIELSIFLYDLTKDFPSEEKFGLVSQMRRAGVSVPSNIAEGASRSTSKEFGRFLEFSMGSLFELETQAIIAYKKLFISESNYLELKDQLNSMQKRVNALRTSILKTKD